MRASLAPIVLGVLLAASPAAAQVEPCLTDPLDCAGEVVSDVGGTVDDTVDEVTEAVDGVLGTVGDVVEPGGGGSPPEPSSGGGGTDRRGAGEGPAGRGPRPDETEVSTAAGRRPRDAGTTPFPDRTERAPERTLIERLQRALSEGGEAFVFPLALLLVVGGFLVVQSRFDRSDPKLALAPVDDRDDVLPFS